MIKISISFIHATLSIFHYVPRIILLLILQMLIMSAQKNFAIFCLSPKHTIFFWKSSGKHFLLKKVILDFIRTLFLFSFLYTSLYILLYNFNIVQDIVIILVSITSQVISVLFKNGALESAININWSVQYFLPFNIGCSFGFRFLTIRTTWFKYQCKHKSLIFYLTPNPESNIFYIYCFNFRLKLKWKTFRKSFIIFSLNFFSIWISLIDTF